MPQLKLEDLHGIVLICHDPKACFLAVERADHVLVPVEPTNDMWAGGVFRLAKSRILTPGRRVRVSQKALRGRFERGEARIMFVQGDARQTIVVSVPTPEVMFQQRRYTMVIAAVNNPLGGKESA